MSKTSASKDERPHKKVADKRSISEGGMIPLETLIELKLLRSSF